MARTWQEDTMMVSVMIIAIAHLTDILNYQNNFTLVSKVLLSAQKGDLNSITIITSQSVRQFEPAWWLILQH
jgi:hypothetical protein